MQLLKEELEKDYNNLQSVRKLAKKYNVNHKTMSKYLKELNIHYNPKITRTKKDFRTFNFHV